MANRDNVKPFVKGDKRINRKGRPKGVKNLSTIVQNLLGDEELIDKVITQKPSYWNNLPTKNGATAIVVTMMVHALKGDKQAAEWLRKTGYGDKLIHDFEDGLFEKPQIVFNVVKEVQTNKKSE